MGQLDRYLAKAGRTHQQYITMTEELRNILRDWLALLQLVGWRPTHVKELVEHRPQYQGFVDASKWRAGRVWFSGIASMIPIVWFLEWPQEIWDQFCSSANKSGQLTILDLELTGILLRWLVLEQPVDTKTLKHNRIAIWCDNLPAVAWTYKFRTSTSPIAARILRALAVRLHENQTALLSVEHISGIFNNMADVASRKHNTDRKHFLIDFSAHFPPPQDACSSSATKLRQKSIPNCSISNRLWNLSHSERIDVLVLFAQHVRSGGVSPGKREVCAQTVVVLLRAVAAKFEMDGQSYTVVTAQGKYHQKISQRIEGYRRDNPAPKYKIAVPLTVPTYMYNYGKTGNAKHKAIGDMALIAFYYLLRVGELRARGMNALGHNNSGYKT
jgi:hypothetical protein